MFTTLVLALTTLASTPDKGEIGDLCEEHSECRDGLVCVIVLGGQDECPGSLEEDPEAPPVGTCERACETDVECPGDATCNEHGFCNR